MSETLIDLLRHGSPVGGRRYRGQKDDPLSEKGWKQMRHATAGATPWQQIISSPLRRCSEFAEELSVRLGVPLALDARLQEIGFGEWEGQSPEELMQGDPEILRRYHHDPLNNRPAGAESLEAFRRRIGDAYDDALTRHAGSHLLMVAHAGVIRGLISKILEIPTETMFRIHVDVAHLSRIRINRERPHTLMFHGRDRLDQ